MSQIVTRKGPVGEDKEKRQTDSPVKDMKKKIAANAEKEKQAAEKPAEKSASDKSPEKSDKSADKKEKDKSVEKVDKKENKNAEKADKADKKEKDKGTEKVDKKDKEKSADKKEKAPEKSPKKEDKVEKKEEKAKEDNKEKNAKTDRKEDEKKPEENSKQNGARTLNGDQNGDTVSSEDEDLDTDRDEIFPELAYDDSDVELFERPTPEGLPSRSYTRRSQVKAARTPETPRPASDKRVDPPPAADESKEKVLKLKEDAATERKLRSSASPKPEKIAKKTDSPRKGEEKRDDRPMEIEVVIELDNEDEARKPDTNYSRSRVKVSPYRRSTRHADVTCSSTAANYTGNNTTMEMDITESSFVSEAPDSPYLSGLRAIRGRRSYKPLKEMNLRNIGANRSTRSTASLIVNEPVRPTGTVVGRKRKPDSEGVELAEEALGDDVVGGVVEGKRPRLLQRLARPFRTLAAPRHAEIVGINTDLPLTAPVACADVFDPEAIKAEEPAVVAAPAPSVPITGRPALTHDRQDPKRCVIV